MAWRDKLKEALGRQPLPEMARPARGLSSVLIPIGWNRETGREEIVLTKRTMLVETHKGQVSFPGGYCETTDCSLLETALRESQEEIGTRPADIEVLGSLPAVITRGDVKIFPWVGSLPLPYDFQLSAAEVQRLLLLPLQRLLDEGLEPHEVNLGTYRFRGPGIVVDGELVWGATARMLEMLRERLLAAG